MSPAGGSAAGQSKWIPRGAHLLRRGASKVQRDSIVTLQRHKCSSLPQELLAVLLQEECTLSDGQWTAAPSGMVGVRSHLRLWQVEHACRPAAKGGRGKASHIAAQQGPLQDLHGALCSGPKAAALWILIP